MLLSLTSWVKYINLFRIMEGNGRGLLSVDDGKWFMANKGKYIPPQTLLVAKLLYKY